MLITLDALLQEELVRGRVAQDGGGDIGRAVSRERPPSRRELVQRRAEGKQVAARVAHAGEGELRALLDRAGDDPELRAWLGNFIKGRKPGDPGVPKQVFLVHGDPPAQDAIKPKIEAMGFGFFIPLFFVTVRRLLGRPQ